MFANGQCVWRVAKPKRSFRVLIPEPSCYSLYTVLAVCANCVGGKAILLATVLIHNNSENQKNIDH